MSFQRILVVDEDLTSRESLTQALQSVGYCVSVSASGEEALSRLGAEPADMLIAGLRMSGMTGLDFCKHVFERHPDLPVIMTAPHSAVEILSRAMELGAVDYLLKPTHPDTLKLVIERVSHAHRVEAELHHMRREFAGVGTPPLVAESTGMVELLRSAARSSRADGTVLITGERGTGKDRIAQLVHQSGAETDGPFVRLDCSALSDDLLESELFGHERGAFTGAHERRIGRFELATSGTLVLDSINETSMRFQSKLLRALQEGSYVRVGGTTPVEIEARLIALTSYDLATEVAAGKFNEQLYYALHQLPLNIPPLRERTADVVPLIRQVAEGLAKSRQLEPPRFEEEALQLMQKHDWPGNVPELQSAVQRAMSMSGGGTIVASHIALGPACGELPGDRAKLGLEDDVVAEAVANNRMADIERVAILATLESTRGNKTEAARRLGLTARTLSNKMKIWRQRGLVA